jgi:hypothetical protein
MPDDRQKTLARTARLPSGAWAVQPARQYRLRRLAEASETPLKSIASSVASISTVAFSPSGRSISNVPDSKRLILASQYVLSDRVIGTVYTSSARANIRSSMLCDASWE